MNIKSIITTTAVITALVQPLSVSADDWMDRIENNVYLHQLSIPGSHDTATGHGFNGLGSIFGSSYAQTQDLTIEAQWNSGIRAFDLRPAYSDGELVIYHGIMETKLSMQQALTTICQLLNAHPTEVAIVVMRHESDADDGTDEWKQPMLDLLNNPDIRPYLADYAPNMTLGNARGKLLLLSRDQYDTKPIGAFLTKWSHDTALSNQKCTAAMKGAGTQTTTTFYVQDFYDCSANGAKQKKTSAITTLLDYSTTYAGQGHIWFINHLSGYSLTESFFGSEVSLSDGYRDNAATQHQAVIDYLSTHNGPMGLMMMDYAGTDRSGNYDVKGLAVTEAIIENNFRSTLRKNDTATGIAAATQQGPASYYTLSGHSLGNKPQGKGCYIMRKGTTTKKTIVR